jgi:hypothetical protein
MQSFLGQESYRTFQRRVREASRSSLEMIFKTDIMGMYQINMTYHKCHWYGRREEWAEIASSL